MSIGAPSTQRQKTPLELRRDEDLTRAIPRGRPDVPAVAPSPVSAVARSVAPTQPVQPPRSEPRLADAPLAPSPRPLGSPGPPSPHSIADSLRTLDERLAAASARGLSTGTVQQVGTSPLLFDPQGADFTAWINHFKNEVYRNWIVPPSVSMGIRGQVAIEFVVERNGTMSAVRVLSSSGTPSLDRAAQNALLGSRFLPLPADFRPDRVPIQVTFFYNARGSGS